MKEEYKMYYEANIHSLKKYRNNLYQIIKQKETNIPNRLNIDSEITRVGDYALVVNKDNHQYRLNSKYNPKEEARKWAEQFLIKDLDAVITMFGFGNGVFVRELINKMRDDNLLIIYEPSIEIFLYVLRTYDIEDIIKDNRIYFVIEGLNEFELPILLCKTLSWKNMYSNINCLHPGYDKLSKDSFVCFMNAIKDNLFNNILTKNTFTLMGMKIIENTFNNLKYIANTNTIWDINDYLPKDIPAIVVAAGPSLNKNVDILKQAKGKSVIFAVDRSYETLKKHNIEPDFIVTLDSRKKLMYCGNQRGFKVPLLCKFEASPDILDNHDGKKIIYNCEEFICNIYKNLGKKFYNISTGGSVATAAFSICANLGFKRIVLVGQDLAYLDDLTHAGEQTDKNEGEKTINLFVKDIYGNMVKTRHDWYAFLRSYENVIPQLKETDVIDATEGGAYIKGTRVMKLQDVVNQYCTMDFNCKNIIDNQVTTFNKDDLRILYDYLVTSKSHLKEIKDLSLQAINELRLYKTKINNDGEKLLRNMAKINGNIESKSIYSLINLYIASKDSEEINSLYLITNNKKLDEDIAFNNANVIYKNIIEACDFITPFINNVINSFSVNA